MEKVMAYTTSWKEELEVRHMTLLFPTMERSYHLWERKILAHTGSKAFYDRLVAGEDANYRQVPVLRAFLIYPDPYIDAVRCLYGKEKP